MRNIKENSENANTVKIETDFVDEEGKPIVVSVSQDIYERTKIKLRKVGLTPKKAAFGIVFVGAAAGVTYVIKKRKERNANEKLNLSDEKLHRFAELTEENWDNINIYFTNRINNKSDADELTQVTFLKALLNYHSFTPEKGLENPEKSWIYKIASNLLKNYYRDTSVLSKNETTSYVGDLYMLDEFHAIRSVNPENDLLDLQDKQFFTEAVENLTDDRARFVLYLKLLELTNQEIAEIFDTSEGAIKSLFYRISKSLHNFIVKNDN